MKENPSEGKSRRVRGKNTKLLGPTLMVVRARGAGWTGPGRRGLTDVVPGRDPGRPGPPGSAARPHHLCCRGARLL